ncbi:MAG: error-prone DNA polymerase [Burkholderiaceae bacterium]|nr:error-prone DNA polymerase [Burkholderiaceae bacterium]
MAGPSPSLPDYAELRCLSNFSFLRGASHPEELVERAKKLRSPALAIPAACAWAAVAPAHPAAKEHGLTLLIGSQFAVEIEEPFAPFTLIVIACNGSGYGNLCEFITQLRRASAKGSYRLRMQDIDPQALAHCVVLVSPQRPATPEQLLAAAHWALDRFMGRCWLAVELVRRLDDEMWLHRLREVSCLTAIPLVACGDVHMHLRSRKVLQDVLTATRLNLPLTQCGRALQPNAERHLRTRLKLAQTYPPELLTETLHVAARCCFSLEELRYQYPDEVVPAGETPASHLRRITYEGAGRRWPDGIPAQVQEQIEHELALVTELKYEHYFLTVADIVAYARSRHILCQGRGSAANSVICYCTGVTEVDPSRMSTLFERFISRERNEPPDIDIDFEHERREEIVQYLYEKYGRDRAALTATVISYRSRSAIRDVGKALGFDAATLDALAKGHHWWDGAGIAPERLAEVGLSAESLKVRQLIKLTAQLIGCPRHLSQHVGGFVLTRGPLSRMVPIERAAMQNRTVIEWDKDDLDAMGLLKVDVLALGMLSAIRKALVYIGERKGHVFELQDIPPEDHPTYEMLSRADSIGVFQVESRAQMSMLPRLRPQRYYDLVIQVAIIRPGPIQGGMIHPYLRRREGKEPVSYPSEALRQALGRTLGVPIFQEQVMQVAMLAAGFTAGEADGLRRAMAAWKRKGGLEKYHAKLVDGMTARGYDPAFAEAIFAQIHGFSEYGFPESHAASFALLVYASAWIKRHHPAEFLAALLNSQPMGFYSPSQLVQDARRHGVEVRPVDVMASDWDCTCEDLPNPPAVRLGLRMISGMKQAPAERIVAARAQAPFDDAEDLARRAALDEPEMRRLAGADALASLAGHRRQQVWEAAALKTPPKLLHDAPVREHFLELVPAPESEEIVFDYASTGLTLRRHPLALLRPMLRERRLRSAEELHDLPDGALVRCCGIVTLRQQPETAKGTIFVTLEDESGVVQVIVWRHVRDAQRRALLQSKLLAVYGRWQREGEIRNVVAQRLLDLTPLLGRLAQRTRSRDFH